MDREYYRQQALNGFPACFHLRGEKGHIGRAIIMILIGLYILQEFFILYMGGMKVFLILIILAIHAGINYIVFKWNPRVSIVVSLLSTVLVLLFSGTQSTGVDPVKIFYLLISVWAAIAIFIDSRADKIAGERFQSITSAEIEHDMQNSNKILFEGAETEKDTFFDEGPKDDEELDYSVKDKPVWAAEVNCFKPSEFCPKCGFGRIPGETSCSVCGTSYEDEKQPADE